MNIIKQISARNHNVHLKPLIEYLDKFYKDLIQIKNPIIYNKDELLKNSSNETSLKEQYHIKEDPSLALRFDHTYPMFVGPDYLVQHLNLKNVGPVFRNDFKYGLRWRQFHQYDVDYLYVDHQIRPFLKALKIVEDLGIESKIVINDISIIRAYLPATRVTEENIKETLKNTVIDPVQYKELLYTKYPVLRQYDTKLNIDPHLIRGWNYYTDLVFEFIYEPKVVSFVAGGVYKNLQNKKTYLGVSFGLDRILKIKERSGSREFQVPPTPVVLIYNKAPILPYNLLDALEENEIPYCLKAQNHGLLKDYKKIETALRTSNKSIAKTLIIGPVEIDSGRYQFREKESSETKLYELPELINYLKNSFKNK